MRTSGGPAAFEAVHPTWRPDDLDAHRVGDALGFLRGEDLFPGELATQGVGRTLEIGRDPELLEHEPLGLTGLTQLSGD